MMDKSRRLASFFDSKGFTLRERACLHLPNCIDYSYSMFGTLANGMTVTTVNPAYTAHEMTTQLKSSTPRVVITNSQFLDTARKAADNVSSVDVIVCLDEVSVSDSGVVNMSDILEKGNPTFSADLSTIDPIEDVAFILYSSGTTGLPKGVMIKHYGMTSNVLQILDFFGDNMPKDVLAVLPMFHIYGLNVIKLCNFYYGNTVHSLPAFEPAQFLSCLQNNKVRFTFYLQQT